MNFIKKILFPNEYNNEIIATKTKKLLEDIDSRIERGLAKSKRGFFMRSKDYKLYKRLQKRLQTILFNNE